MREVIIRTNLTIPECELNEFFVRSTGPGGQNVNKVATKVELRWTPAQSTVLSSWEKEYVCTRLASRLTERGELIIGSEVHRTQMRNRDEVRKKLIILIRQALLRPKKRRATKPSRSSIRRRLKAKKNRSDIKKNRAKGKWDD